MTALEAGGVTAASYRVAVVLCGVAVVGVLIHTIGPETILASFRQLSWRLVVVIVFPCVLLKTLDTLAWQFSFPHERVPFLPLAATLLAGQAVASTTPAGVIGGNAAMAWMVRDRVKPRESVPSLIIVQTTSTASQGLFLLIGILLAMWRLDSSPGLLRAMKWVLLLETVGVAGFVAVQMRGVVSGGSGILSRLGWSGSARIAEAATSVDRALSDFYRTQPWRLMLSLGCNLLGWFVRAGEIWLILYMLGAPISVSLALIIEAFLTGISFATFFLPTDVGVEESGTVVVFLALGLSGGTALSLALVRRIREVAWTALGLLLLARTPRPSLAAVRAQGA